MKKFFREFKDFAMRGNVLDLAIGVIIGGAFQGIVKSLVDDIISPFLGLFGGMDFSNLSFNIGDVPIRYGAFITEIINFIIMAFVIFLLVKIVAKITSFGRKEVAVTTKKCPYCCSEIALEATRCPHCTAVLTEIEEEDADEEPDAENT